MIDAKDSGEAAGLVEVEAPRTCGNCTVCCTLIGVGALAKPPKQKCDNASKDGCRIYEDRPDGCRTFSCLWLAVPQFGQARDRPDRLGLMFDETVSDEFTAKFGPQSLVAREAWRGSSKTRQAIRQLWTLRRDGVTVLLLRWHGAPVVLLPVAVRLLPKASS